MERRKETVYLVIGENGEPCGWYAANEEDLCKAYCELYGYTYRAEEIDA